MNLALGLVGHGIQRSLSPNLHRILGDLVGQPVDYPVFDQDASFTPDLGRFLDQCAREGRAGVNVTHPFKEAVYAHIEPDNLVEALGACNTVCFTSDGGRIGHNTDCTGLEQAIRPFVESEGPGLVAQLGAGGFGRAAAFALSRVGVTELRIFDPNPERALDLARRVATHTDIRPQVVNSVEQAIRDADGVVNCSPIGMHHHPGNPVPPGLLTGVSWVFDAVYVPMHTELLQAAVSVGATVISGAELFFWQAIHAFEHFTGELLSEAIISAARATIWPEVERRALVGE
jgi:shikimate dehydrogenase